MKRIKNALGFTFLETLIHFVAFLLFSKLLLLIILHTSALYQQNKENEMQWEMFIIDFRNLVLQADQVVVHTNGKEIRIVQGNQVRYVNQSNETIRVRLNTGNEILYVGVHSLHFSQNEHFLKLKVQRKDGHIEERIFIVPT